MAKVKTKAEKRAENKKFSSSANKTKLDEKEHYKSICVRLSKNESDLLDKIVSAENRTLANSIRRSIIVYAKSV